MLEAIAIELVQNLGLNCLFPLILMIYIDWAFEEFRNTSIIE